MRKDGPNILITLNEWQAAGLSFDTYRNDKQRGYLQTANRACYGSGVEIIWQSIVKECRKEAIKARLGNPEQVAAVSEFEACIIPDKEAMQLFSEYLLSDGRNLPNDVQIEYYNNAIVLNAINMLVNSRKSRRRALGNGIGAMWPQIAAAVNELDRTKYPHTLPAHERRLREKHSIYQREGCVSLIHKSFCNDNARKVSAQLERLILSIYCSTNKPYAAWVCEDYLAFIAGMLDIVDMQTGVLFDRADFYDEKKGTYITISEATCWNYINNPKNRATVEALRSTRHRYVGTIRPHYHRHNAKYSLSKISLDDRDLPRRMHDGNRVKAYYAYDVASGALIGAAYSVKKDVNLFIECVRDTFRFVDAHGYGMPLEVEVEHHLVGLFKDDLMKAGVVFPFVRFCAPGNSQEKHAEQFNRQKKYGYEKRYQDGIGRFYAKQEANQTGGERVYEDATNKYVIKEQTYSFEQLVADDLAMIEAYNNGQHRNQKMYKDKTRLEVLHGNLNPDLAEINRAVLVRYIGDCTVTTIQRNMYCQVQYSDYMLPSPELLARLAPNNYTVQAYYMPGDTIERVYIYQNNEFICECARVQTFSTSQAETTDTDTAAMTTQAQYIAKFDKMVKGGRSNLAAVKSIKNLQQYEAVEVEAVPVRELEPVLVDNYNDEYQAEIAIDNL